IRTDCFQHFINVRSPANWTVASAAIGAANGPMAGPAPLTFTLGRYLFDSLVQQTLKRKCKLFDERLQNKENGMLLFAKGTGIMALCYRNHLFYLCCACLCEGRWK